MAWQTNASDAVLQSQEFWRLTKIVESPGDIFEQDVSTRAIAIGPDSDIAKVKATYYDPVSDNVFRISEAIIATGAPLSGRLDALLATPYPNTAKGVLKAFPAKVLFSLENIVDENFPIANETATNTFRAPTKLDLISYVSDPGGIVPQRRPDKQIDFDSAPPASGSGVEKFINFVVPYFGRRSASIYCKAIPDPLNPPGGNLRAFLVGVNINEGESPLFPIIGISANFSDTLFDTGGAGSFANEATIKINANDDGLWDYLVFTIGGFPDGYQYAPGDFRLQFNVSDEG